MLFSGSKLTGATFIVCPIIVRPMGCGRPAMGRCIWPGMGRCIWPGMGRCIWPAIGRCPIIGRCTVLCGSMYTELSLRRKRISSK